MELHAGLCFVFLGIFLFSNIFRSNCKKLNGYEFPVYSTDVCPVNETEWNARSSAINCTTNNGYICIPNNELTQLLEFCYTQPFIWIQADICLYLVKRLSKVNAYNCSGFRSGCLSHAFVSSKLFEYPSCTSIQNGCFIAESSCERKTKIEQLENVSISDENVLANHRAKPTDHWNEWILYVVLLGVFVIIVYAFFLLVILRRKDNPLCKRNLNTNDCNKEEIEPFVNKENKDTQNLNKKVVNSEENIQDDKHLEKKSDYVGVSTEIDNDYGKRTNNSKKESIFDRTIFEQWQQDNNLFISTRACKKVEQLIKEHNLVIVAGHTGSGKSAIIQHVALKYRSQGWIVKPIYKVRELINDSLIIQNKTLFVLNDPIGKESVDEKAYDTWIQHEEKILALLKKTKTLISCRKYVLSDARITGILKDTSYIVDINNDQLKLNDDEKQTLLRSHSECNTFGKEELAVIMKTDAYFPLLCKLYSGNVKYQNDGWRFFKEPVVVLEKEIRSFKTSSKEKYCALALLVLFNNVLCVNDLLRDKISKGKYKHALELCGMIENTAPYTIGNTLESMKGFFVTKIGESFQFYHDLIIEITAYVFGSDYPEDIIEYADVSFLRRRVRIEGCEDPNNKFSVVLNDRYVDCLGKRLFIELLGERHLDVVLNPCLKNGKVSNAVMKELDLHPEKNKMLLEKKVIQEEKQEVYQETENAFLSKLSLLNLIYETSPMCALIVFCHTHLSLYCLNALKQMNADIDNISLFCAVCCNGSLDFLKVFRKEQIKLFLKDKWSCIHPIHVVSAFHNIEMMRYFIKFDVDVNLQSVNKDGCTPLFYAAANNFKDTDNNINEIANETRRNETIQLLLSNGAKINLCNQNGSNPLYAACYDGLESTVQLLLSNGANINLCRKDGFTPLYIACRNGHENTVNILINSGADINLFKNNQASPLSAACQNGHDNIVELLLSNGAEINLCNANEYTPFFEACINGHVSTVLLLLSNGADIHLLENNGANPLSAACQNGLDSIVELILKNGAKINLKNKKGDTPLIDACLNGHVSTVQLLLSNGADINLCSDNGVSPLYVACQEGYDSTVQLLLSNRADVNLCSENGGFSPLLLACHKGHDSIVELLLSNGADFDICLKNGASPLFLACTNGHNIIVKHLLNAGADLNVCRKNKVSPLLIACCMGHDDAVQLLLRNGADINLYHQDGATPLFMACQNGHDTIVRRLLNNGADINLYKINKATPLYVACYEKHESTVDILVSNEADIDLCYENGSSPLQIACQNKLNRTVQLLLSKDANVNLCKQNGVGPLFSACQEGNKSIVQLLLRNGADVNLCRNDGSSCLHEACKHGHYSIVKLLLNSASTVNSCDINGASPLSLACKEGHESVVKLLLNNGANVNLCRTGGRSPLLLARENGNDNIVQLLRSNGADANLCL